MENGPIKTFFAFLLILFSILGCSDSEVDDSPSKLEEAIFNFYNVSATVYGNGTFNSSGGNRVKEGESIRITIKPTEGWVITSIKVDGTELIPDQIIITDIPENNIVDGIYKNYYSEFSFDKIIDKDYEYEISFCLADFNLCQNNFNSSLSNIEYFIEEDGFKNDVSNKNKIINFKNGFEKAQEYFGSINNIKVFMFHSQENVEESPIFYEFRDKLNLSLVNNNACITEDRLNYHNFSLQRWLLGQEASPGYYDAWSFQSGGEFYYPEGFSRSHMLPQNKLSYCNDEVYLWLNLASRSPNVNSPYIDEDYYFHIGVESYVDIIQIFKEYESWDVEKLNNIPEWFWRGEQEFISHYIAEKENINSVYFDRIDLDNDEIYWAYQIGFYPRLELPLTNKYFIELLNKIDVFYNDKNSADLGYRDVFGFELVRSNNTVQDAIDAIGYYSNNNFGGGGYVNQPLPYRAFGGWAIAYLFYINNYNFDLVFKEFRSNVASSDFDSAFTQTFGYSVETFLAGYYDFLENNNERSSILQFN
tara:strand:+ start:8015 stop:9610 length:1596 start_codon:yes stop_codon:yes gene_type:complete